MFSLFRRDPLTELQKRYATLMKQAQDMQRNGDIPAFARRDAEAREVLARIEALEAERSRG